MVNPSVAEIEEADTERWTKHWLALVESGSLVGARLRFFEKPGNEQWEQEIVRTHVSGGIVEVVVAETWLNLNKAEDGPHIHKPLTGCVSHRIPLKTALYEWTAGEKHYYFNLRSEQFKTDSFTIHLKKPQVLS